MRLRPVVLAALLSASCGSGARDELARVVALHCRTSEETLRLALATNEAGGDEVPGHGDLRRPELSNDLFREFSFCKAARRGDPAELTELSVEFHKAAASMGRPGEDPATRGEAMRRMLELFERINRLPLAR